MAPKVILISLDGATDTIVDKYLQTGVLSSSTGLGLLKSKGLSATANETITPSLTAPAHIAIATGSTAVNNDINANTFHLIANPFTSNTSGFAAPIGGYNYQSGIDPSESGNPTANPIWLALKNAGKTVVAATFPGADGVNIKSSTGIVLDKAADRTVDYTVPFGAFGGPFFTGGSGGRGFSLTAANFNVDSAQAVTGLNALGKTFYGAVKVANLETLTATALTGNSSAGYDLKVAAIDTSNDNTVNYDTLVVFDANVGIKGPSSLPSTGSAFIKVSDPKSIPFFFDGSNNKVGTAFYASTLAPDLSKVNIARYSAYYIPRPAESPGVIANVDDINNNIGFWAPQADFRFPERINTGLTQFSDAELEAIYEDQVKTFVEYQTKVLLRSIQQNPNADLVLGYIEQPDGSEHQFLLTDPRQATDFTNPNSIGAGQDAAKVARYKGYVETAYKLANEAVQKVIDTVGVDANGDPNSNIIVVSDHGFSPFHTAVSMNNLLKNAGFDSNKVRAITSGPAVNIYINLKGREPNGTVEVAEYLTLQQQVKTLLNSLVDTNPNYVNSGATSNKVFDKIYSRQVPANATTANEVINARGEFIGEDTGDVFALLSTGYNFDGVQSATAPVIRKGDDPNSQSTAVFSVPNFYGAHGYDPTLPDMKAIFYAAGPDVSQQSLGNVNNIDVAPTIEKILGVTPAATVNGTALTLNSVLPTPTEAGKTVVESSKLLANTTFATSFIPTGAAGTVNGNQVAIGGLSGVTYDAANDRYYAISDDRSSIAPARFYTFTLDKTTGAVTFTNVTPIKDAGGNFFGVNSLDPEGIALTKNGTVFISSEGEANPAVGRVTAPFVKEFNLTTGQEVRSLSIPTKFVPVVQDTNNNNVVDAGDTQTAGVRNNLAFESLTISPDQKTLFTATENALFQDGVAADVNNGTRSRIVQFNLTTGQAEKEYLYVTDKVAVSPNPANAFATNGLVDLLAIDNRGTFLALERSFSTGAVGTIANTGNTIKIYEISLQGATDISVNASLSSLTAEQLAAIAPVQKRLLLSLDSLNLPTGTDNIEGITFGPKLADGRQSIVLVSDNNFSSTQFTQILTLSADVVPTAAPLNETRPALIDDGTKPFSQRADADDPAVYVNATDASKSLVVTSVKNGGLRIYDLAGNLLQTINPSNPDIRYNNVDLQYGFTLGGQKVDIAVASDRNNDKLAIFKIDANGTGGNYLTNITDPSAATIFQGAPFTGEFDPDSISAYGLTIYRSPVTQDYYVFTSRRETGDIAQLKLVDKGNGAIGYQLVRNFTVPTIDGRDPQTEGMVVDQETGFLYIGQENVGIWKYGAEPNSSNVGTLIDKVKALGGKNLIEDVEGLTIYYGKDGAGYLFVSSQGDNTFAAYAREGNNDFIGRFAIGNNGAIDSVQESDGADVINVPLGGNFPFGAFITQDGSNDPAVLVEDDGELENISSNFKFVPFENIANAFATPLTIDTTSYDPRNPQANSLLNGVASGDTTQTSTVLWTRSNFTGNVKFEYSTKSDFSTIAGAKTATVTNPLQPVKVDVTGLTPDTNYFYRVTDAAGDIATGKFSTAAAIGKQTGLRFGVAGDWRGELAPYPAISNADDRNLKFFFEFGDTIYGDVASPALRNADGTEKSQATTLDDYRTKYTEVYGQRYGQNPWADLRASTSILATIDDHEVTNDFAGGAPIASDSRFQAAFPSDSGSALINDSTLFENGLQAFQEYKPIQDQFYGQTGDPRTAGERKLYRVNTYGSDAVNFVLDARSFRDPELAGVTNPNNPTQVGTFLAQSFNPSRTLLGRAQVDDLKHDLLKAQQDGITWKFINIPEPIQNLGIVGAGDRYEGYAAERTEILKFIDDNKINNVVFISADIHGTLVNNLTYQLGVGQAQIATNAFEITTGSVAYDAPFGPTVADLAVAAGLINSQQKAFYDSLPVANDADSTPNDKDDFIKSIVDGGLAPLGYDPLGLNNNLAQANGLINATLLQGDYVATHTYGWTEFDIDPLTQKLTVTTYGIDSYTRAQLEANPEAITSRQPKIVSQFEVLPQTIQPKSQLVVGTPGDDDLTALNGATFDGRNNQVFTGAGNDTVDLLFNAGAFGAGNNRINLGRGADTIFVNQHERVFGSDGDDTFEASEGRGGNRIAGGAGNDTFFLGHNDRALGGEGNDQFYVGTGADNLLSGGAGADQFWLVNGELPEGANTILDFQAGVDVIGFSGSAALGISPTSLTLVQAGANTVIRLGTQALGILNGIEAASLNLTDASQFVFA
ncbi:phytase [Synechocystis sp. LKSZ1]|uniref:phytase n=1 Tax=Synechocystis sp. LKSZ1 TaxID=3144951 RepID=UPI00336BAEB2